MCHKRKVFPVLGWSLETYIWMYLFVDAMLTNWQLYGGWDATNRCFQSKLRTVTCRVLLKASCPGAQ